MHNAPIASLGGGNMASAILTGAVNDGTVPADSIHIADRNADRRADAERLGMHAVDHARELRHVLEYPNVILMIAVKPQALTDAANDLPSVGRRLLVCSILGGVPASTVAEALQKPLGERPAVVRVMPNTPSQVGLGVTALSTNTDVTPEELARVRALFDTVGDTFEIDESLMDAFSAVAGSGPAYLFLLAEALEAAALDVGLPHQHARSIVAHTLLGAATLLQRGLPTAPAERRAAVTSKGGSTHEAVTVAQNAGFTDLWVRAVRAARDRSVAMGTEAARIGPA